MFKVTVIEDGETKEFAGFIPAKIPRVADWLRDETAKKTVWVDVEIESEDGIIDALTIPVHPVEPPCVAEAHDWQEGKAQSSGGGVAWTDACTRCGMLKSVNTWDQRPDTGAQGLYSEKYEQGPKPNSYVKVCLAPGSWGEGTDEERAALDLKVEKRLAAWLESEYAWLKVTITHRDAWTRVETSEMEEKDLTDRIHYLVGCVRDEVLLEENEAP